MLADEELDPRIPCQKVFLQAWEKKQAKFRLNTQNQLVNEHFTIPI